MGQFNVKSTHPRPDSNHGPPRYWPGATLGGQAWSKRGIITVLLSIYHAVRHWRVYAKGTACTRFLPISQGSTIVGTRIQLTSQAYPHMHMATTTLKAGL